MKTIGIKLADGSFYPIMQEGQPCKKTLGLTTVKDNQTRIVVDLYRSKSNSMEDAEYVILFRLTVLFLIRMEKQIFRLISVLMKITNFMQN